MVSRRTIAARPTDRAGRARRAAGARIGEAARRFPFWKMHGAGNDFVLVDDRAGSFPSADREWLKRLGARRTGIGCDGFILIQPSRQAHFRMRFFNPDGSEADMCGNGARCVARLARDLGVAPAAMRFETHAGDVAAVVRAGGRVQLHLTAPRDWRLQQRLEIPPQTVAYGFVNSGVPHAVIEVNDLAGVDVPRLGAAVRYHAAFAPAGTNVNFIAVTGPQALRIRTYERGVEDETLACGTGMVASALVAARQGRVKSPVRLTCASGHRLEVAFVLTADGARDVTLIGPAEYVFTGEITTQEPRRQRRPKTARKKTGASPCIRPQPAL